MSIGTIFVGLALLILSIPIVAGPIINKKREQFLLIDKPGEAAAQDNYRQTLLALRDLDFDHQLGIVAEDDHAALRAQLLAQAVAARETSKANQETDLEERIESAVRARRRTRYHKRTPEAANLACYHCGTDMEQGDKFCAGCGSAAIPPCPQCGLQPDPEDNFCPSCGVHLRVRVAT